MAVHQPQKVWLPALGVLAVLMWSAQFSADWFVSHSDIGIAQLDKIELATVSHTERSEIGRVSRLENKPDPAASMASPFADDAIPTHRNLIAFVTENARRKPTTTLHGIRAPPHYLLSA